LCSAWCSRCSSRWARISKIRALLGAGARVYISVIRGTARCLRPAVHRVFYALPQLGLVIDPVPVGAVIAFSLNVGG